jgi:hypothetical protein
MDPSLIHCSSSGWEKVAIPLLTYDSDLWRGQTICSCCLCIHFCYALVCKNIKTIKHRSSVHNIRSPIVNMQPTETHGGMIGARNQLWRSLITRQDRYEYPRERLNCERWLTQVRRRNFMWSYDGHMVAVGR